MAETLEKQTSRLVLSMATDSTQKDTNGQDFITKRIEELKALTATF